MKIRIYTYIFLASILCISVLAHAQQIDLSGKWYFQTDPNNQGISEKWFAKKLTETISLPGSMATNNKGDEVTINTKWVGEILDSSYFKSPKYARYRRADNLKIPFWLQPVKYYSGAAWYQKEVDLSANGGGKNVELFLERPHWETQLWIDNQYIGMKNSLGTAHVYTLPNGLKAGKHLITIRVDNSIKDIVVGASAHSISDQTQTNWNGMVGGLFLKAVSKVFVENIKIYPNIESKNIRVVADIKNATNKPQNCIVTLSVTPKNTLKSTIKPLSQTIKVSENGGAFDFVLPMGENPLLWDEFDPNLYVLTIDLKSEKDLHQKQTTFGMREIKVKGKQFTVNNRLIFLRGTLECAIFPLTGYPSVKTEDWKRIFKIVQNHGLNHVRFHSWCPPEAAFEAADELGVYLQVEASSWANDHNSTIGDDRPVDKWIYQETTDILNAYGNHPSFCLMAYGNEPGGKKQTEYLNKYVSFFKNLDNRRMYTGGAGWPFVEKADYYNHAGARIQAWGAGLKSIINSKAPQTVFDFKNIVDKTPMPYVSHEIGQWCVYPNFKEMSKYTGILKPKNFEIFQETLAENGMAALADSFLLASGKLQALCYKADIEAALRTKDFAGFQLLDLHDFPGQGTALVGVLDAFWDEKGYISPKEYSQFCNQTVPLARLPKRIFYNTDTLKATIELAHFGAKPLQNAGTSWQIKDVENNVIFKGNFEARDMPIGNGTPLGELNLELKTIQNPQKLTLSVQVGDFTNTWDIWVYPAQKPIIEGEKEQLKIVHQLDINTLKYLEEGGKVLFNCTKDSLRAEKGGSVGIGFSSIFWNTAYTNGQKPTTLGILCNPNHPALSEFPTEYHSNWQWWDAMSHSNALFLDGFSKPISPIVRVIDDWYSNKKLALLFEVKIGKGKLLVSGIDLHTNLEKRPEAQQLLYSLKKYMMSANFNPSVILDKSEVMNLTK
jgi:Glycosyl hydrolases family 2/Glycosyl hydrolases family 2, sugar binding domain/Glycosyl hydrolases family 2, TIM barrel domain